MNMRTRLGVAIILSGISIVAGCNDDVMEDVTIREGGRS